MPETCARPALALVLLCGCLRAPIDGDALEDSGGDASSTGAIEDADGPGMSGPIAPDGGDSSDDGDATSGDEDPSPACHASYLPCLPVVDDLDCDEVRAMGAAPVEVVGEDAYGLDADDDGIGCEN